MQDPKIVKNSPSGHHRTTLSGYIFAIKARIDNRNNVVIVKQQYLPHMSLQYGELRPTSSWDMLASLGTTTNFNGFRVLAALLRGTSSGRQPNFAAFNRGRHLYSAGRPSHWALTYFLVLSVVFIVINRVHHHFTFATFWTDWCVIRDVMLCCHDVLKMLCKTWRTMTWRQQPSKLWNDTF